MNRKLSALPALALSTTLLLVAACSGGHATDSAAADANRWAAVARGQVAVPGGMLRVAAPLAGRIQEVAVAAGDAVRAGDVLATLDDAPARSQVEIAEAGLRQAQAEAELLVLQRRAAREQAEREAAAAAAGAGDGQAADAARARVAELGARHDAAQAAVAAARAQAERARHQLGEHTLRAPVDAFVTNVFTQPGASVAANADALFELLPDRPLIIRAELNASYIDAIETGTAARITLEDQPDGQAWTAHVSRIGRVLRASTLDEDPAAGAAERTVSCELAFDEPVELQVGRRVLVQFLPAGTDRPKD